MMVLNIAEIGLTTSPYKKCFTNCGAITCLFSIMKVPSTFKDIQREVFNFFPLKD
jgi:hypothetical protein